MLERNRARRLVEPNGCDHPARAVDSTQVKTAVRGLGCNRLFVLIVSFAAMKGYVIKSSLTLNRTLDRHGQEVQKRSRAGRIHRIRSFDIHSRT